jgi:hypothetical protein
MLGFAETSQRPLSAMFPPLLKPWRCDRDFGVPSLSGKCDRSPNPNPLQESPIAVLR